ncbi:arginine/serine-rich protein PNISR-like [Uranotaenia lowii]|uniref:arginine/serine-rich protein PNISR-like n=1 Tax=Uranotaenia lowii TaxID=190385 RepID=UPI00247A5F27|nr:arginine/serine-rich protein PNISR-like [Uranotaenia lowii]
MYNRSNNGGGSRNQNGSNSRQPGTSAGATTIHPVKSYQTTDSNSAESPGWSALNPNLYQNMSNSQVDWAALAQQWIQMKETLPASMVPAAPPPPIISDNYNSNSRDSSSDGFRTTGSIGEQGEAPMEVERDEEPSHSTDWSNRNVAPWHYSNQSQWQNPAWDGGNWSVGSGQVDKASSVPSYESGSGMVAVNPNASQAVANWQAKMARIYKIGEPIISGAIPGNVQLAPPNAQHTNQQPQLDLGSASKRIPGLMDQMIKFDPHDSTSFDHQNDPELEDESGSQGLNDAKRKLLPAWIREGLEKMEREKLRVAEKEKEQKQRAEALEQRRKAEMEALAEMEQANKKSKFESDSEEEDGVKDEQPQGVEDNEIPATTRPRDEIIQELMVSVRKNLTEILLEVTNEEISVLAKETLVKTKRKAPTAQTLRKTGLASITGGLGLGIYGDSDEDEESGSDNDETANSENEEETEKSLKVSIKQRQKEFERTAREIEEQIEQEEAREERKRREYEQRMCQDASPQKPANDSDDDDYSRSVGGGRAGLGHSQQSSFAAGSGGQGSRFGPRDGETQPVNDKLNFYKLGRSRDKRISRFSDPKDTVRQTHITHVAIVNHKPGEVVSQLQMLSKSTQPLSMAAAGSSGISPPIVNPASVPLFPAALISSLQHESYQRGNSVASETPSHASSSRASSSHRESSKTSSRSKSHKSKKHKRSRYSSEEEDDYYDEEDRYSHRSRRSRSSERSGYSSRRRRSHSRDSRDDARSRKRSYRSRDRSRSRSRDRYRSSRHRSRSRSRSPSSRKRY